jgi:hypothetical protein
MRRHSFFLFVVVVATAVSAGCGSTGPQIHLEAAAAVQRSAEIVTVDVLPVETRLSIFEADPARAQAVGVAFRSAVMSRIGAALRQRRYRLASIIDRAGNYSVGVVRQAMTEEELSATLVDLDAHAETQLRSPERLLPLVVHSPLGRQTGSHATLYVGGDAFVGNERFDMADFLATLALINTVATGVATVSEATSGDKSDRLERASGTAAEGMATTADLLESAEIAAEERTEPRLPSHLRLVLTMVDNRTRSILWHSDRTFPFNPSTPDQVRRALELSLRKVPRGGWRAPRARQHLVVR